MMNEEEVLEVLDEVGNHFKACCSVFPNENFKRYINAVESAQYWLLTQKLKEKAVKPKEQEETRSWTVCGHCGNHLISKWDLCPYCGRRIDWIG